MAAAIFTIATFFSYVSGKSKALSCLGVKDRSRYKIPNPMILTGALGVLQKRAVTEKVVGR